MLYAGVYTAMSNRDHVAAGEALALFLNWAPPDGFAFVNHVARADGMGGILIAEVSSHAALLEATAAFTSYFDFQLFPVLDVQEAIPVLTRAQAWVGDRLEEMDDDYEDEE